MEHILVAVFNHSKVKYDTACLSVTELFLYFIKYCLSVRFLLLFYSFDFVFFTKHLYYFLSVIKINYKLILIQSPFFYLLITEIYGFAYTFCCIMVDVVGDNWKAICIPDSYGNVANNIPADTVLTFEEMQTYNEVTSEVIDRSRNSRDIEQDNGQMVMGFEPVPQNIEDSFDTLEVHAVSETMYEGVWAFLDDNNSVYIGKPQNILNGTYDNSDNSLVKLSDNEKIYDFLTVGENGFEQSQQQMLDLRRMSIEDYREITHLQETVLSSYEQKYDLKFAMERFKAVSDETVMVHHDKGKAQNYRTNALDMATGGQVGRFLANVKAIETLRTLEKENRYATQEEQAVLAKYSGWGGLSQAFDSRNAAWGGRYNQLKELLTDSEYREARASITSAFYTPESVKNAVYQGLAQLGFSGGEVLEPSCGIGGFIGAIAKKTELLAKAQDDLNRYKGNKPESSEDFSIKLNGTEFTERKEAAQELEKLINRCIANSGSLSVGEYSGFKLSIEKNPNYGTMGYIDGDVPCYLKMQGELTYECPLKINNGTGNITRIENLPENTIAKRTADIAESLQTDKNNLESAKAELDKPFSQADELKAKEQELAEVNAELGTDKSDDVISVGGESDDRSEEQNIGDDEEIDKADKRDDTMAIKGYDISHLQKKSQSQDTPSQNAPEPPKAKKHDPKL
ncbi:MAG TPA: hypothetical protein PLH98_13350 [Ruminococcus flavefaciens]|nr:hypothetical protein [Ruminococcus flavefaciens]